MEFIINHIRNHVFLYLICLIIILVLIILYLILKSKKVKPIEYTIDDEKEEPSEMEKVIEALGYDTESRPMTTFEEEQEANAIISYQELVKVVNEKTGTSEANVIKEPSKEAKMLEEEIKKITNPEANNIDIDEEIKKITNPEENEEENKVEETTPKEDTHKFKNSEFISPVFGKDSNNDHFLKELKDFRNNL